MVFSFLDTKITIDDSWDEIFQNNAELLKIEQILTCQKEIITPKIDLIFRVFTKPVGDIEFIILGQDPYPQKDVATGRAFEVSNLASWNDKTNNTSLINILKSLYYYETKRIESINIIRKDIEDNKFIICTPNKLFEEWENSGLFLLNTSLTCVIGESNSHEWLWRNFTDKLIEHIYEIKNKKTWLLWGKYAFDKLSKLNFNGNSYNEICKAIHPANSGKEFITSSGLDLLKLTV